MASDFVGYLILVTLHSPQGGQLQGVVANVVDHRLYLQNVTLLWNGQRLPTYTLEASAIADLEVSPQQDLFTEDAEATPIALKDYGKHAALSEIKQNVPGPSQQPFLDPAIVSYEKPPAVAIATVPPPQKISQTQVLSPIMIADGEVISPSRFSHISNSRAFTQSSVSSMASTLPLTTNKNTRRESSATATLAGPFDSLPLDENGQLTEDHSIGPRTETVQGKPKNRRSKKNSIKESSIPNVLNTPGDANVSAAKVILTKPKKPTDAKGWRQTPLIEEAVPVKKLSKSKKGKTRKTFLEDANGWATEDATDIQDMGEFDFQNNLAKFDKRRVFDDIRKDDTTADDERLVSFNRKARLGTNGGRNLHYTENVLDPVDVNDSRWKSEAGETEEEELREEHYSSGKGSRRAGSRKPVPSRKGSLFPSLDRVGRTESPRPLTRTSTGVSPMNGSTAVSRASFRVTKTNQQCPSVSPLQMLEIEQVCTSELGMTEDMLAENAGRGIAEAAISMLPDARSSGVLFLVGNHKSGARAVAGARHLRNRGHRVLVCVLGGEREESLLENLRKQVNIYKKMGGHMVKWDEFQNRTESTQAPQMNLVLDSLLGMHAAFDELRTDDQAVAFEMISWANRSTIPILSIDVPSGLSATTGEVTDLEGQLLRMESHEVLSLAAPKTGWLDTMTTGPTTDCRTSVADIGIPAMAWRKYGTRRRHGVDFGGQWVIGVKVGGESSFIAS